jgi:hypothetical protein
MDKKIDKTRMTYAYWVERYKGKLIDDITLMEHKLYHRQYKAWRMGNIEKVF